MNFSLFSSYASKGNKAKRPFPPRLPMDNSQQEPQPHPFNQYLLKYQDIMEISGTPMTNQMITTQFQGRMLTLNQPSPGKVSLSFDDITQKFRYDIKNYCLQKINYKTVVAAIKGTHPQIISASFTRNQEDVHTLTVKVSYQFLPQILEILVFERQEIPAEDSDQAVIRGMRGYVRGIREQLNSIGNVQVLQGVLDETTDTQVFVRLTHKRTVFTWALNMHSMASAVIKPQMWYYNSTTKQRKTSGSIPEGGVYVNNNGKGYVEMKLMAECEDYDMVIFRIEGKGHGEYTISSQKVERMN